HVDRDVVGLGKFKSVAEFAGGGLAVGFCVVPFRTQPGIGVGTYAFSGLVCKVEGVVIARSKDDVLVVGKLELRDTTEPAVLGDAHNYDALRIGLADFSQCVCKELIP